MIKGVIFDLDGVLTSTSENHYLCWKKIADELNIEFNRKLNENLKGISRSDSLKYILNLNKTVIDKDKFNLLLKKKNSLYLESLKSLTKKDLYEGALDLILDLKKNKIKVSLGSASKNSELILKKLEIYHLFDCISDGNSTKKSKPDPEVFINAANYVDLKYDECVVIEDSRSGIKAAISGGFFYIGIGSKKDLGIDKPVYNSVSEIACQDILNVKN